MRMHIVIAGLTGLLASAGGALSAPPPSLIDRVLANGLAVTIAPDTSLPIVATRVWYHVGAANETKDTRGFAHLFEHLMFSGTPTHEKGAWEAHHHRFGGIENAHTSWDETTYESDIPPAGIHDVLAMEADRMVNLRLDEAALENEKKIVTEELRATIENDPYDRMLVAALKSLGGDHPSAVTPLGTTQVDPFREDLVRKRRQALEAGIQVLSLRRGGVLCFYSAVLPYRREAGQFDVMNETMRTLERKEWLTDARLAGAKRKMLRAIELQRYRAADLADALAKERWWRGDATLAFTRADRLAAISRADVARVFDRYVTNAKPVAVYIQPEKVPVMLQLFGWLLPLVMR